MEYAVFGKTGLKVSRLCLGTMPFGSERALPVVKKALDCGINFLDTANIYAGGRSEELLGEAIKGCRDEIVICTKVFFATTDKPLSRGLNRHHVSLELEKSLKRLQTGYIDLYLAHRLDNSVSLENILMTMNHAILQGKVLHIGTSTMYAWEYAKSLWVADRLGLEPFQVMQNQYNLLYREEEREMLPLCRDQNIGVMCWSPLARGALTGKHTREKRADTPRGQQDTELHHWYLRPNDFLIIDRVVEIASQKECSPAQIALSWLLSKEPPIFPIIGATDTKHVEEAVEALQIKLSDSEITYLEELYRPRGLIGHYSGNPMPDDPR